MHYKSANELLIYLNRTYYKIHTEFETYFWLSMMGDHSVNDKKDAAQKKREAFRTNTELKQVVDTWIKKTNGTTKERLGYWKSFFSLDQVPPELVPLKNEILALETKVEKKRSTQKEGYSDPKNKKFIELSRNGMGSLMQTHEDEAVRKACFEAREKLAAEHVNDYVELVKKRNEFARKLGYTDFYAYKLAVEERMTKKELFDLFDEIYEKTKYGFKNIRALEKQKPGLRKPWNFGFMMAGSFVKEADPYFPFEKAVPWWIETFARLGINFQGGKLVLDLLDRKGKYNNGFCHWPSPIHYEGTTRIPATAQFTCTLVPGIPGQAAQGLHTLFHEGGHAAHYGNIKNKDICLNIEYPPASTAWAETQSMFLDTVGSSIEWTTRYAKNGKGESYPFDLFLRQAKALHPLTPLDFMGILFVTNFEKAAYEMKNPTREKIIALARRMHQKYSDKTVTSLWILDVPHIYAWDSACSYHGYGLAELALSQWRNYFFKKYGYIVDNPRVGKEMQKVWEYGSRISFPELVKKATGKKISPKAYIESITRSLPEIEKQARARIARLEKVPQKPLKGNELNASITLVHGQHIIADSKKGYDAMVKKYAEWLKTQYPSTIK